MNEVFYFGIDGGGTYSRLAITNRVGAILCKVEAGSTNIYSVTSEEVFQNLKTLLDLGLQKAGLEKTDLLAGCIGSAGLGRERERSLFHDFFKTLLGQHFPVKLCTDGEILICGGLASSEGYGLIAGTGSIALGRTSDGTLVRSGGFGYMLGDEGSAAWIGRSAIARSLRSQEGRDLPTAMLPNILAVAGLEQHADLINYVHLQADKAKIASLAPIVTKAARQGDLLALDILRTGAVELSLLVKSVLDQSPTIKNKTLVMAGGVLEHDEIVHNSLKELLTRDFPFLRLETPKGNALDGACMLARNETAILNRVVQELKFLNNSIVT
jgi:N-acetylglucosamine kinase-like BadF-type ATPase